MARREVQELLWSRAGILRDGPSLAAGLEHWQAMKQRFERGSASGDSASWWEARQMLIAAQLILTAARERCESRGAHFRTDFPARDDARWKGSLFLQRNSDLDGPEFSFRPAPTKEQPAVQG
jgi:succinate dehydrogenase/fumarate reductase flavoprotein subunit